MDTTLTTLPGLQPTGTAFTGQAGCTCTALRRDCLDAVALAARGEAGAADGLDAMRTALAIGKWTGTAATLYGERVDGLLRIAAVGRGEASATHAWASGVIAP